MKMTIAFCAIVMLGLLSSAATNLQHSILYIPFGVDTFVAVTAGNIDECYNRYSDVSQDSAEMREVFSLISSGGDGKFDKDMVRAKIRIGNGEWIYVDNLGGISTGSRESKLAPAQFARLNSILDRITSKRERSYRVEGDTKN